MSGPSASEPTPGRTLRTRLRSRRGLIAAVLGVLLVAVLTALATAGGPAGQLDPAATDRSGSAALAALLRGQGVRIDVVRTADEALATGRGDTLFVARPDRLDTAGLFAVGHGGADVVLAAPQGRVLETLVPGARSAPGLTRPGPDPACPLPAAQRAGPVDLEGSYVPPPGVGACYPDNTGAGILTTRSAAGAALVAVAGAEPFTNESLAARGNAALALGLLGDHARVVWYLPAPAAAPGDERSLGELVPAGWWWGAVQLAVAAVLAALWRGRRFGSVVSERLPVVVRATETTEGRAGLYRRGGARDRAARALREDTRRALARRLGLSPSAGPDTLVPAVAAATGRPPAAVGPLLAGGPPPDDAALVALAADLDDLRTAVADSHPSEPHPTRGAP